jgi:hypothetical protein
MVRYSRGMSERWNVYGDVRTETTGAHGADIASQRLDDLDRRALEDVRQRTTGGCTAIDLGGGSGWQSLRFALLGAEAHVFDLLPQPPVLARLQAAGRLRLRYHTGDVRVTLPDRLPAVVHVGYSQRFVHYLPFDDAVRVLSLVARGMPAGARFFLSASGLESELGDGYDACERPLADRFSRLRPDRRESHGIHEPVCLYREDDLRALMAAAGFTPATVWRSRFGNIKGVFEREE